MTNPESSIPCPFCALGCDDLSLSRRTGAVSVDAAGCPRAESGFAAALDAPAATPAIGGAPAELEAVLSFAAARIRAARLPLFGGMAGDLNDLRGVVRLAEVAGGVVDHRNGDGLMTGLAVLQGRGWITTSLGDARNRADLWLLVGDLTRHFPRLEERLLGRRPRLQGSDEAPALVVLDEDGADTPERPGVERIRVDPTGTHDFIQALRARLAGRPLDNEVHPQVAALAERLGAARFPVVALTAGALPGRYPDLLVRSLAGLVGTLNEAGRAALLPLGLGDGDITAQQVSAWHTGFSVRTSFHAGIPQHDPLTWSGERLVAAGEADLRVWVSPLNPEPPPPCDVPTLVLGHPATRLAAAPEAFVPLAVPGVHRHGVVHRGDGATLLPLRALEDTGLPAGKDVLERLRQLVLQETAK